ncbi:MAG TPA: MarR family transcriptional regulator [Methanolinea sp.]|nr:MarR family transcriptional regulator [Methanolinea sp.]HQI14198.1 MarR family transcriptional regulator [Methanolinea sp.]
MHPDLPLGAFFSLIHRNHSIALNRHLVPRGLAAGQFPILMYLSRKEGVMQETLARFFYLDKATVARAVRRLERSGFISRKKIPGKRRAWGLFLTEKGRETIAEILGIEAEWEGELLSVLAGEERDMVRDLLGVLAQQSMHLIGESCGDD